MTTTIEDNVVSPAFTNKMAEYLKGLGYLTGNLKGERNKHQITDPLGISVQFRSTNFLEWICGCRFIHCRIYWNEKFQNIKMAVCGRGKNDKHFEAMKTLAEKISLEFNQPVTVILYSDEFEYDWDTEIDMRC